MLKNIIYLMSLTLFILGCQNLVKNSKLNEDNNKYIHVESPEWENQVIYFLMIDRFNDGDKANNDQGVGEYNKENNAYYSGGDIKGIIEKIEYIKKLGATAVWITPPVANQWWNDTVKYSGYHGYWAENFKEIDKHYGTIDDYKKLSIELHKNGMHLIQDIVCNHTGDFFDIKFNENNEVSIFKYYEGAKPSNKPSQYPFNLNNFNDINERNMNIYHWTPSISDYNNENEILTYQMSGLDDLNTENKLVRQSLKESFNYWIREVGVDGYRIDTAIYVEHDFWHDFINSKDEKYPGVREFAKKYKKNDFFTFGETWVNVEPYNETGDLKASSYIGTIEKPEMTSVLNFPLHVDLVRVFSEGKATSLLSYRIENMFKYYREPYKLLNFIDNHDMARFLSYSPTIALKQALMFIMTIPGIPVIYYGTEQFFTETRGAMFKDGYGSGGKDWFNAESDSFKFLSKLIEIRKKYDVFRRGKITILQDNRANSGVFAYKMEYKNEIGYIIFNTSDEPTLLSNLETGLESGTKLKLQFGLLRYDSDMVTSENGKISTILQPRAGMIFFVDKNKIEKVESNKNNMQIRVLNFEKDKIFDKNFILTGKAYNIKCDLRENEDWEVLVPIENLENGQHFLAIYGYNNDKNNFFVTENYIFNVYKEDILMYEYFDKKNDDKGLNGKYIYPKAKDFENCMDIDTVKVYKNGKNLKINVKMVKELSTIWNPKYGFDHVIFNIYFEIPGLDGGVNYMPFQNGKLPNSMKWNYMAVVGGWISSIYESKGSSENSFGNSVTPAPKIVVSKENKEISFIFSNKSLGNIDNFSGVKIYISTWDYDGMENKYRDINILPGEYTFGGSEPGSVYVMDDIEIIELK